jgi:hypothetical protein
MVDQSLDSLDELIRFGPLNRLSNAASSTQREWSQNSRGSRTER